MNSLPLSARCCLLACTACGDGARPAPDLCSTVGLSLECCVSQGNLEAERKEEEKRQEKARKREEARLAAEREAAEEHAKAEAARLKVRICCLCARCLGRKSLAGAMLPPSSGYCCCICSTRRVDSAVIGISFAAPSCRVYSPTVMLTKCVKATFC